MIRRTNLKIWLIISVFLAGFAPAVVAGRTIYVDADASTGGDGITWGTAYKYLQDGIANPTTGDEVWVAEGTYYPDQDEAGNVTPGDRTETFSLINGVSIYGGYQTGGTGLHDPQSYPTILSGNIGAAGNTDNSYHVVTGNGTDATAVLDGFTITAGNADAGGSNNHGGGMYNQFGSPTVTNCTFSGNSSGIHGGGMYNYRGTPMVTNCMFTRNSADYGGGMSNQSSSTTVTNCMFTGNSSNYGGGMYNEGSSQMVTNCTFIGNSADIGGGICSNSGNNLTVNNCIFGFNPATLGWLVAAVNESYMLVSYSVINFSSGIYDDLSSTVARGPGNITADPMFIDADGPDNIFGTEDDNLRLSAGSPCVDAGDNTAVLPDSTDLDRDGNTTEPIPWDLDGNPRFFDEPYTPNTGNGTPPIVDMGAYERSYTLLTVSSGSGGSVATPGEGLFYYGSGEVVPIVAQAEANYEFVEWTGTAVDTGKVVNASAAGTTVTMEGDYTLVANFVRPIIYVDVNATGANDGTSWEDAYKHLQDALAIAITNGEILVAAGTYEPDENTANPSGTGSRTATFQLINGVGIYGGFPSGGGGRDERDPSAYETILSGDIGTADVNTDNSYHVVTGFTTDATTILDGFIITAGNANGSHPYNKGGGMYNSQGSPTVTDCTFTGNTAVVGAGMCNHSNSNPTVTNCAFSGNYAAQIGGGMRNYMSSPELVNCIFNGNSASSDGGGMENYNSNPALTNCILWGNAAPGGAQIYNDGTSSPAVNYSCVHDWGGGGTGNIALDPLFVDADEGNLRLLFGSPCIDTGDNMALPPAVTTDLDGHLRFVDGDCNDTIIVDMGAYEFAWVYIGDFYGGCDVDFRDFAILALTWLLEDGDIGYNPNCDISLPPDYIIDEYDLKIFTDNWLADK